MDKAARRESMSAKTDGPLGSGDDICPGRCRGTQPSRMSRKVSSRDDGDEDDDKCERWRTGGS